MVIDYPIMR